jgi:hypothetical protein
MTDRKPRVLRHLTDVEIERLIDARLEPLRRELATLTRTGAPPMPPRGSRQLPWWRRAAHALGLIVLLLWVTPTRAQIYNFFPPTGTTYNPATAQWSGSVPECASINPQTGTSYTLALSDANQCVSMSNASPNTLTIPLNATVAFPVGTLETILQAGTGITTISGASGVTIVNAMASAGGKLPALNTGAQNGIVILSKTATNTWEVLHVYSGLMYFNTVMIGCSLTLSSGCNAENDASVIFSNGVSFIGFTPIGQYLIGTETDTMGMDIDGTGYDDFYFKDHLGDSFNFGEGEGYLELDAPANQYNAGGNSTVMSDPGTTSSYGSFVLSVHNGAITAFALQCQGETQAGMPLLTGGPTAPSCESSTGTQYAGGEAGDVPYSLGANGVEFMRMDPTTATGVLTLKVGASATPVTVATFTNSSGAVASVVGSSASSSTLTLTGPAAGGGILLAGVATGTNADFLCMSSAGAILIQSSPCTISSARFKTELSPMDEDGRALLRLPLWHFRLTAANADKNAAQPQLGLLAEDVARVLPACAIYEQDLRTPKSYRPECLIAYLIALGKTHERALTVNRAWLALLTLWCLLLTLARTWRSSP